MNNKKNALSMALTVALGVAGCSAQAAMLNTNMLLTITPGVYAETYGNIYDVSSGSYFAFDWNQNSKISGTEKVSIYPDSDGGLVIGFTQQLGGIDSIYNDNGGHSTTVAPTGGTTFGIDFSGWALQKWGVTPQLGGGAWTPLDCASLGCSGVGFADGVAAFSWDGFIDHAYSLWYTATVPVGDLSGLGGMRYLLYLEGVVTSQIIIDPVPVPAAVWLFGSGLIGLLGIARQRRVS